MAIKAKKKEEKKSMVSVLLQSVSSYCPVSPAFLTWEVGEKKGEVLESFPSSSEGFIPV